MKRARWLASITARQRLRKNRQPHPTFTRSAASGVGQRRYRDGGLVPDAANGLRKGADWLIFDRIFGKRPEMTNSITGGNLSDLGTSASLKKSAEGLLGKFYEPADDRRGNTPKTVGEFVPCFHA